MDTDDISSYSIRAGQRSKAEEHGDIEGGGPPRQNMMGTVFEERNWDDQSRRGRSLPSVQGSQNRPTTGQRRLNQRGFAASLPNCVERRKMREPHR